MSDHSSDGLGSISRRRILVFEVLALSGVVVVPSLAYSILYFNTGTHLYYLFDAPYVLTDIFATVGLPLLVIFTLWVAGEPLQSFGLTKWRWGDHVPATIFIAAGLAVVWLTGRAFLPPILHRSLAPSDIGWQSFGLLAISLIFAAFLEEVFYRGYLIPRLTEFFGKTYWAVIASTVTFGLTHLYQGWIGALVCTGLGVVFAYGFLIWRSIWPLAIAHAAYNFYIVCAYYRT